MAEDDITPPVIGTEPPIEDEKQPRRSIAAQLVDLARSEYDLGLSDTDEAFGVKANRPHIALPLRGGKTGFRAELARRFFNDHQQVPGQQALADACTVLEGYAAQLHSTRVWLRVAEAMGEVFIDTGDSEGSVIRIAGGRWSIVTETPVKFRRTRLTGEMDVPRPGGDLTLLWDFVPIDAEDRPVLLAWLIAALIAPDAPHPVLGLLAEQGSAKSSITRCLVDLIDPSPVPLRQGPRDADGWVTAASASWVVALDNLSGDLQAWLSDSLCRAATGDGSVRRALYTDADVSVFAFRRCVILNGIDLRISGGDLAERLATIELPRIQANQRRAEAELAEAWAEAAPYVLGGLLDLAAQVHEILPTITITELPRMADYAIVLGAVDQILGSAGLDRYRARARKAAGDTLDHPLIAELVARKFTFEAQTSKEILAALTPDISGWKAPKDWPKSARAVTAQLTRDAPALRQQGWTIDHDGGRSKDGVTRWTITAPETTGEQYPPPPPNPQAQVTRQKLGGAKAICSSAVDQALPAGGSHKVQAGDRESADPPKKQGPASGNGEDGQAGQRYGSTLASIPPPGAPTDETPGLTDRVKRILANSSRSACDTCGTALSPQNATGMCAECKLIARQEAVALQLATLTPNGDPA